jgi:hypothetical protein
MNNYRSKEIFTASIIKIILKLLLSELNYSLESRRLKIEDTVVTVSISVASTLK